MLKNQAKDLENYLLAFLNEVLEKLMNNTYIADNQIFTKMIVQISDFEYNGEKLHIGQILTAKIICADDQGSINLSLKF